MAPGSAPTPPAPGAPTLKSDRIRPSKREQTPRNIVRALLFLASSDSDFMTGETIVVDGGAVMR
jgi:NAD(P)-dependent dehydrogenase (short-subunit alcohol dehydrogenase family)